MLSSSYVMIGYTDPQQYCTYLESFTKFKFRFQQRKAILLRKTEFCEKKIHKQGGGDYYDDEATHSWVHWKNGSTIASQSFSVLHWTRPASRGRSNTKQCISETLNEFRFRIAMVVFERRKGGNWCWSNNHDQLIVTYQHLIFPLDTKFQPRFLRSGTPTLS